MFQAKSTWQFHINFEITPPFPPPKEALHGNNLAPRQASQHLSSLDLFPEDSVSLLA